MLKNNIDTHQGFAQDVLKGLSANPKLLPSQYFYNEKGDAIFQQIMKMPSYYLTGCEYEILEREKEQILKVFSKDNKPFQLIELGAGDGTKTKLMLQHFLEKDAPFDYFPIDISENVLDVLTTDLNATFPTLKVFPQQGEYFEALHGLANGGKSKKIILFLGANIGNFTIDQSLEFLKNMGQHLHKGDLLLIGFDLKKDPALILEAYNDREGITKSFNLNLLQRINDELGGNFNLSAFQHFPSYNPATGEMKSYLISTKAQDVFIEALDKTFPFAAWEAIYVEISQKFALPQIKTVASQAGFNILELFFDSKNYFVDTIWEVK